MDVTRVGFVGAPGAFAEEAAAAMCGAAAALVPFSCLEELLGALETGGVHVASLPVHNTRAGPIQTNVEALRARGARIVDEVELRIVLSLVTPRGVSVEAVRRVLSHPVAFAQCQSWLRARPSLIMEETPSTSHAVCRVMRETTGDAAAVASRRAADLAGASVLVDDVTDRPHAHTKFVLATV